MIIKIQRPLMTNGDEPMALIYDQTRHNINTMIPYFEVEELFAVEGGKEPPLKVHHESTIEMGQLIIAERVEDQDW